MDKYQFGVLTEDKKEEWFDFVASVFEKTGR